MNFVIEPLNANDKSDWIALRTDADPWPVENNREDILEANWEKITNPDNPLKGLALRAEGKLIGYGLYFFSPCIRTASEECMLRDIFVSPEYRRKGAGTALMNVIHDKANQQGAGRIFWATNPNREEALAFCQSFDAEYRPERVFVKWLAAA